MHPQGSLALHKTRGTDSDLSVIINYLTLISDTWEFHIFNSILHNSIEGRLIKMFILYYALAIFHLLNLARSG